jgi:hypothetical protein
MRVQGTGCHGQSRRLKLTCQLIQKHGKARTIGVGPVRYLAREKIDAHLSKLGIRILSRAGRRQNNGAPIPWVDAAFYQTTLHQVVDLATDPRGIQVQRTGNGAGALWTCFDQDAQHHGAGRVQTLLLRPRIDLRFEAREGAQQMGQGQGHGSRTAFLFSVAYPIRMWHMGARLFYHPKLQKCA